MMVACSHLWSGYIWWQGIYAVFGFYVISGYLMSLIINEVYTGKNGTMRYAANRILRIYPVYWVCLFLSILLFAIFRPEVTSFLENNDVARYAVMEPDGLKGWIKNLTFYGSVETRLVITQGWSLRVEMVFYALMLILCRRFWIVILWLIVSIYICYYQASNEVSFIDRYNTIQGASLAFSLGAMVYYLRKSVTMPRLFSIVIPIVFFTHLVFAYKIWGFKLENFGLYGLLRKDDFGLYMHTVLSALLLWVILDNESILKDRKKLKSAGTYLGKIAYGVFLCHWLVLFVLGLLGMDVTNKYIFIPVSFIGVNLLAWALYSWVEKPIDKRFRDRIRPEKVTA